MVVNGIHYAWIQGLKEDARENKLRQLSTADIKPLTSYILHNAASAQTQFIEDSVKELGFIKCFF